MTSETTDAVRVWLVERTYSDDEQNLIILTYATTDGEQYFRKERALTSFGDERDTTAAVDAAPDNLGSVTDPDLQDSSPWRWTERWALNPLFVAISTICRCAFMPCSSDVRCRSNSASIGVVVAMGITYAGTLRPHAANQSFPLSNKTLRTDK